VHSVVDDFGGIDEYSGAPLVTVSSRARNPTIPAIWLCNGELAAVKVLLRLLHFLLLQLLLLLHTYMMAELVVIGAGMFSKELSLGDCSSGRPDLSFKWLLFHKRPA
jgi:hypothetical protein